MSKYTISFSSQLLFCFLKLCVCNLVSEFSNYSTNYSFQRELDNIWQLKYHELDKFKKIVREGLVCPEVDWSGEKFSFFTDLINSSSSFWVWNCMFYSIILYILTLPIKVVFYLHFQGQSIVWLEPGFEQRQPISNCHEFWSRIDLFILPPSPPHSFTW